MPILAHQKVASGDAGTIIFFSALATATASFMHELRLIGPVGVRVQVAIHEIRDRSKFVASRAAQPLRKHARGDTKIGTFTECAGLIWLPREWTQLFDLVAEHELYILQKAWRRNLGYTGSAFPYLVPGVQAHGHNGEMRQIHNRSGPIGVHQRRSSG